MKSTRKMLLAGLIGAATILATSSASAFWGNWGSSPWNWGGWGNSWGHNWGGGPWGGGPWGYGGGYPYYGGYGGYPYYGGWGNSWGSPWGYGGGYPNYGGYGYGYSPYSTYAYPTTTTKPAAKKAEKK